MMYRGTLTISCKYAKAFASTTDVYFDRCSCPAGYSGAHCQHFVEMCAARPCANGGRCHNTPGDFRCECTSGYFGKYCTQDRDECAELGARACDNGGRCVNRVGSYSCICREGFEGSRCDRRVRRLPVPPVIPVPSATTTSAGSSRPVTTSATTLAPDGPVVAPGSDEIIDGIKTGAISVSSNSELIHPPEKSPADQGYVSKVKVTHIVHQVEVGGDPNLFVERLVEKHNGDESSEQASVSVVQAVTFSFLGVAVVLFIAILAFVWFHCSRKRKAASCGATAGPADAEVNRPVSVVCGEHSCSRGNFVVLPADELAPAQHTNDARCCAAEAGALARSFREQRLARPESVLRTSVPVVDCLYVALPQDSASGSPPTLNHEHKTCLDSTNRTHCRRWRCYLVSHCQSIILHCYITEVYCLPFFFLQPHRAGWLWPEPCVHFFVLFRAKIIGTDDGPWTKTSHHVTRVDSGWAWSSHARRLPHGRNPPLQLNSPCCLNFWKQQGLYGLAKL